MNSSEMWFNHTITIEIIHLIDMKQVTVRAIFNDKQIQHHNPNSSSDLEYWVKTTQSQV